MSTRTGDWARFVTIAATAVAQAPVPQARVSPAPRSKVRNFSASCNIGPTLTLIRSGNAGSFSILGPSSSSGTSRASGTKKTTCGIADVHRERVIEAVPRHRQRGRVHRIGERDLVPAEARLADADLDLAPEILALEQAARRCRCSSRRSAATTQRVALPQLSTSPPSLFQMRILRSAVSLGSRTISWSQPTPVRRSAIARASAGVTSNGVSRASTITKSLPRPCILWKCRRIGRVT